jgi:hypothetical protein
VGQSRESFGGDDREALDFLYPQERFTLYLYPSYATVIPRAGSKKLKLKLKIVNILAKVEALRIILNIDGVPVCVQSCL